MSTYDFELARQVENLAKGAKDSDLHWICTPNGELITNNGGSWCSTCGFYMFRHLPTVGDPKRAKVALSASQEAK